MPVVALETAFEFLEGALQKLHYLMRRSEWEAHVDYMADEYDLLTFYLETGFNVGEVEFAEKQGLVIYGLSEKLDRYYRGKALGKPIPKPALQLTNWWKDILKQLEKRGFDGWTEIGMSLLSMSRSDQWSFEKAADKLKKSVRKNWHEKGHDCFLIGFTGPLERRIAISAYAFKEHISRQERDPNLREVVNKVSAETGCNEVVVIGIDADDKGYPYQFIGLAHRE